MFTDDATDVGFVYPGPWPEDPREQLERLPDEWLEPAGDSERVKSDYRRYIPVPAVLSPDGHDAPEGLPLSRLPGALPLLPPV